jgi:hypothetical protein
MKSRSGKKVRKLYKGIYPRVITATHGGKRMSTLIFSPYWFHGIDTLFEAFSGVVALLIALAGYRAYKLAKDKKYFYFSAAFVFITLSFLARAFTTLYFVFSGLNDVPGAGVAQSLGQPVLGGFNIFVIGRFAYVLLTLFAYLILLLLSMRPTDRKTDRRIIALLSVFVVLFTALSYANSLAFYLVALAFLIFITANFLNNCRSKRTAPSKLIFLAFAALTFEYLLWLFANYNPASPLVVFAYLARAVGYLLLLFTMLRVYRK